MPAGASNIITSDFANRRKPVEKNEQSLGEDEEQNEQKDDRMHVTVSTKVLEEAYGPSEEEVYVVYFVTLHVQYKVL